MPVLGVGEGHTILNERATFFAARGAAQGYSLKSVVRGTASWRTDQWAITLNPDRVLLVPEGEPYEITIDSESPVETLCLFFRPAFLSGLTADECATDIALETLRDPIGWCGRGWEKDRDMARMLQSLRNGAHGLARDTVAAEGLTREIGWRLLCLSGQVRFEQEAVPALRPSVRRELYRRALTARTFIDEAYQTELTLSALARASALSPFHLQRCFKAAFGVSPHEYQAERRLELAKRLLRNTDRSVLETCLETGYESPATFAAWFHRRTNLTPTAWRRKFARSE